MSVPLQITIYYHHGFYYLQPFCDVRKTNFCLCVVRKLVNYIFDRDHLSYNLHFALYRVHRVVIRMLWTSESSLVIEYGTETKNAVVLTRVIRREQMVGVPWVFILSSRLLCHRLTIPLIDFFINNRSTEYSVKKRHLFFICSVKLRV